MQGTHQPARRNTPKRILRGHIVSWHQRQPARSATMVELSHWHSTQHYRYGTDHYHEGANTGPGGRPEGWRTGEGAVRRQS
jgi:hypothetical protein